MSHNKPAPIVSVNVSDIDDDNEHERLCMRSEEVQRCQRHLLALIAQVEDSIEAIQVAHQVAVDDDPCRCDLCCFDLPGLIYNLGVAENVVSSLTVDPHDVALLARSDAVKAAAAAAEADESAEADEPALVPAYRTEGTLPLPAVPAVPFREWL